MAHFAHSGGLGGITLPLEIFRDPRLKGNDIKFLVTLLEYRDGKSGRTDVGGASIESISGMNKGNLSRTITRLVEFGWVTYTQGNDSAPNEYKVMIPLETGFKYRVKAERYLNEDWKVETKRRKDSIKSYSRVKIRNRGEWWAMSAEDIIEELPHEKKEGKHYIPDDILKHWEILRNGDNSETARERRRDEGPRGTQDMFETDAPADENNDRLLQDLADM